MYDINLIRKNVVPDRRKNAIFSIVSFSVLVCTLTVLAVAFFSTANFRMIDVYAREIDKLEGDLTALYPGTPTLDELATIMRRIKPDLKEISTVINSRTDLTYIWEAVARTVQDDVWLTHVSLKVPRDDGRKVGFRGIVIEGHALSSGETSSEEAIQDFATRLEEDPELKSYISEVKFAETGKMKIDNRSVIGFEITCLFK
jgi:Tfp pilus assembly protein PilN